MAAGGGRDESVDRRRLPCLSLKEVSDGDDALSLALVTGATCHSRSRLAAMRSACV